MAQSLLKVSGLTRSFGGLKVCDDLSFECAAGEALGIIGPNGAGKTTLLNLLGGTLAADGGRILFDQQDITRTTPEQRCRLGIGRSFQIPRPFSGLSVYENLLVAAKFGAAQPPDAAAEHCRTLLEQFDLAPLADRPAGGLRLLERKRLELARALAARPRLLLLDEIAGGLTESECIDLVRDIREIRAQGVTIIWIEHVVHALMAVIDRLLVIDFGHKIAFGEPHTVFNSAEVQKIYMGIEGVIEG